MAEINAPLYNALVQFVYSRPISFHVPGHKSGFVWEEDGYSYFKELLQIDLTELTGLDDLHSPEGVIEKAQSLTAKLYGVKSSFFLVNGTTVGNLSMILASCKSGDRVIVQRNCHKSVMHALFLAKVKPVFVAPNDDVVSRFQTGVDLQVIIKTIRQYPDTKAIILTNPNYYGTATYLKPIIDVAHKNNIPVLVDEAHGAHFCLGSPFPESAIDQGADIVVHSAHKTLPAMTMGSYLHFNSTLVDVKKIKFYLHALQSSSPSYPIMASLDLARAYLEKIRENGFQDIIADHLDFKAMLSEIIGINVMESKALGVRNDPIKVVLHAQGNVTGYELKDMLEKEHIYPEMADSNNVLLVLPLALIKNKEEVIKKIKWALRDLAVFSKESKPQALKITQEQISEIYFTYEQMDDLPTQLVDLLYAEGEIGAEDIIPYPPGIPLIMRGEKINSSHINTIQKLKKQGAVFQGNAYLKQNKITIFTHKGD